MDNFDILVERGLKKSDPYLNDLFKRYPSLESLRDDLHKAFLVLFKSQLSGGKLLICGNGGSAADALHIEGELIKGFNHKRPIDRNLIQSLVEIHPKLGMELGRLLQKPIRAQSLCSASALMTAIINDTSADVIFAQQVFGSGKTGDVLLAISTSGNSKNVLYAVVTARAMGITTIALTGPTGGAVKELADHSVCVPGKNTPEIQEAHLPVYHSLCLMLEAALFDNE